jgi:hypothetical protein
MSICENLLISFEKTNFQIFFNYCNSLKSSIDEKNLTNKEINELLKLVDNLNLIYGLDDSEIGGYLVKFLSFGSGKILEFERAVRAIKIFYPFSFN